MTVRKSTLLYILANHPLLRDDDMIHSIKVGEKSVEVTGKSYDISGEKIIHLNVPIVKFKDDETIEIKEGFKTILK